MSEFKNKVAHHSWIYFEKVELYLNNFLMEIFLLILCQYFIMVKKYFRAGLLLVGVIIFVLRKSHIFKTRSNNIDLSTGLNHVMSSSKMTRGKNLKKPLILIAVICFLVYGGLYENFFERNSELNGLQAGQVVEVEIVNNFEINEYNYIFETRYAGHNYLMKIPKNGKKAYNLGEQNDDVDLNPYGQKLSVRIQEVNQVTNMYENPSSFDYQKYLLSKKINLEVKAKYIETVSASLTPTKGLKNFRYKLLRELPEDGMTGRYAGALFLGQREFSKETSDMLNMLNLLQLFTISGFHVNLLSETVERVLRKTSMGEKSRRILLTLTLLAYRPLAGSSPSVSRATYMAVTKHYVPREVRTNWNLFIILHLYLLNFLFNPMIVYNLGFILSYLFTFVITINKGFLRLFKSRLEKRKSPRSASMRIQSKGLENIMNKFLDGMYMTVLTFPIIIHLSYNFNLLFLFLSGVYEKLVKFMWYFSIIYICTLPPVFYVPHTISNIGLYTLIMCFEGLASINLIFVLQTGEIAKLMPVAYYYFTYGCLKNILFLQKKGYMNIFFLGLTIIFFQFPIRNIKNEVAIIDVGQGDSILIQEKKHNKTILIDTGPEKAGREVTKFLRSKRVRKIDFLILTHNHEDHVGGTEEILKNFDVKRIVINNSLNDSIKEAGISKEAKTAETGDKYGSNQFDMSFLEEYNIDTLSLIESIKIPGIGEIFVPPLSENENNNSLVVHAQIGKFTWLFMGDAEKEEEEYLMSLDYDLDSDFLKMGHHGSKTSSEERFLQVVSPQEAFISSGKNNKYNHPSPETIDHLEELEIKYQDTQESGLISRTYS